MFSHIRSDVMLEPIKGIEDKFKEGAKPNMSEYPSVKTIDFVLN